MSDENIKLENLIIEGFKRSNQKLIKTSAANNEDLIITVNGVIKHVPAKELLQMINTIK